MQSISRFLFTATIAAAFLSTALPAFAQKKGGGSPPPGSIYFKHNGTVWKMNSDGSNQSPLPSSPLEVDTFTHPSHQRHAGQHWFTSRLVPYQDLLFPNGRPLTEVWAVSSETGSRVPLAAPADIEVLSPVMWLPDDQSVSFLGQRWSLDETGVPVEVIEAGLYEVPVAYDGSGFLIGGDPEGPTLIAELSPELRIDEGGFTTSGNDDVAGHSWSPDLSSCAFGVRFNLNGTNAQELWILNLTAVSDPYTVPSSALRLLDSGKGIGWPNWSPDGRRIGYISWDGTVIYDLSRNRTKVLQHGATDNWGMPRWSPDGAYFVTYHWDNFRGYDALYRFTADLTGKTKISGTLCAEGSFSCTLLPLGWRN